MESPSDPEERPPRRVRFAPRANVDRIAKFIADRWSEAVKTAFPETLANHLRPLERLPFAHPLSPRYPSLRQRLVANRTQVHYRVTETAVVTVAIHDTREG